MATGATVAETHVRCTRADCQILLQRELTSIEILVEGDTSDNKKRVSCDSTRLLWGKGVFTAAGIHQGGMGNDMGSN